MSLSVRNRPYGYIKQSSFTGTFTNGSQTVNSPLHGFIFGNRDVIYISTGQSIGFWEVVVVDVNNFKLGTYPNQTIGYYTFLGAGSFTYFSTSRHVYNSAFLPIVYKIYSTLWPTNSDVTRTVSSFSNDNGYTKLTLSGAISTNVSELDFIQLFGPQAGIYQILSWYSNSVITINLTYNSNLTFGSAQWYYPDYHAKVRVYAGITSSHTFAGQKPYELLCELSLKPDSTNYITVNISEIIRKKIDSLKNNLNQGTLPNNLDAWCNFYISYAECYSKSMGGYGLTDFVGTFVDDSTDTLNNSYGAGFEGVAVNASLPFKNVYSGVMSEYLQAIPKNLFTETFDASLDQFSSVAPGDSGWTWTPTNGGSAYVPGLGFGAVSEKLQRPTTITAGKEYTVTIRYYNDASVTLRVYMGTTLIQSIVLNTSGSAISVVFKTIALTSETTLSFIAVLTGISNTYIDRIQVDESQGGKFLTPSVYPVIFGNYFDLSWINQYGSSIYLKKQLYSNSVLTSTVYQTIENYGIGVYRKQISITGSEDRIDVSVVQINIYADETQVSEIKTITVDSTCSNNYLDLSWLNYLGGFDYWRFKAYADFGSEIGEVRTADKNIMQNWPRSYGADADTIRGETKRSSRQSVVCRAENLTADQVDDLYRIKLSPLVQIVNSVTDRRTILLDQDSFIYHPQENKLFEITFTFTYTNENPVQSL